MTMTKIIFLVMSVLLTFNSYAFSFNRIVECNGCSTSQLQQKSVQVSGTLPLGGIIYIFDFNKHNLHKYVVWVEADDGFQNISLNDYLKSLDINENDIINIFDGKDIAGSKAVIVSDIIEVFATTDEINSFNDIDEITDGFATNSVTIENIPPTYVNPQEGGQMIGNSFGVYNLVGNGSLSRSILIQVRNNNQFAIAWFQGVEAITSVFGVLQLDWNLDLLLILPNGSVGLANFVNGELTFDESTFKDTDGNNVPVSASDVTGGTFFFSEGQGSPGFEGFVRRLDLLGVGHGSSSGGGSCTFSCSAQSCVLTCHVN